MNTFKYLFGALFGLIKFPLLVPLFFYQAQNAKYYNSSDKSELFRVLCKLYLLWKIYPYKGNVSCQIFGFTIYAQSYEAHIFLFREIFLANTYYVETSFKTPVIFDCGANIGYVVFYFLKLFPEARITAFEPNPQLFQLLKKNAEENNLQNTKIHDKALWDKKGQIPFYINKNPFMGSVLSDRDLSFGKPTEMKVETVLLSDFIKKEKPDIVKIDVEGAEIQVLHDLTETDTLGIPIQYLIEYHHKTGDKKGELAEFLLPFEKKNYDYNLSARYSKLNSFQDVFIHFFKQQK